MTQIVDEIIEKKVNEFTERECRWAINYLSDKMKILVTDVNYVRKDLILNLQKKPELSSDMFNRKNEWLIPEHILDWLKEDLRAKYFVWQALELSEFSNEIYYYSQITILDKIYSLLDCGRNSKRRNFAFEMINQKIMRLENLKKLYFLVLRADKYSEWLDKDNHKQILWVEEYLKKYNLYINPILEKIGSEEKYKAIVIFFDSHNIDTEFFNPFNVHDYVESLEKTVFINKMKRAWSQQKYRDAGKTKKLYHLPLTKEAKKRLGKLSQIHNLTESTMLQALIDERYEREFLDERGREIY